MPPLPDVVLEEIFLRLPPDEPACLVRASVASKLWLHELTGARFRGRYLDFHGAPPMLGFLYYMSSWDAETVPQPDMLSTTGFRPSGRGSPATAGATGAPRGTAATAASSSRTAI